MRNVASKAERNCLTGTINKFTYIGSIVRYTIDVKGLSSQFVLDVSNPEGKGIFKRGENVTITLPKRFHCIKA